MAEINTVGYQKIRDYIEANWKYIELQDGSGTPIIRLGVDDSTVSWTHSPNDQILKLQIVLSSADITLPKTFEKSAIFDVASGGTALTVETFTAFTMEGVNDELTVEHSIEVPQVV